MSPLNDIVRKTLEEAVAGIEEDEHMREDTLRAFQEQSKLLAITDRVRSSLENDLVADACRVSVTAYDNIATRDDYAQILATVQLVPADSTKDPVDLFFRYERRPGGSPTVSFTVDVTSKGCKLRDSLLWIHIWAAGNGYTGPTCGTVLVAPPSDAEGVEDLGIVTPSPADVEDVLSEEEPKDSPNDDDDMMHGHIAKKRKVESEPSVPVESAADEDEQLDHFVAGADPSSFEQLGPVLSIDPKKDENHGKLLTLLMSFPFYEGEWDLPGMLFDALFDDEDDNVNDNVRNSDR